MGRGVPDSPPDSPSAHINPRTIANSRPSNRFSLGEDDDGFDEHRDTTVFDLTMEDDEGHSILDPAYAPGQRKLRLCGLDCSRLQPCLPCLPFSPPDWWYRYSRRQRKLMCLGCVMASVVISLIIFAVVVIHLADIPNKVSVTSLNLDAASLPECSWQEWRLPQNVTPTAYDLALETNMQEPYQVNGTVKITLQVLQPTLCVVLHATAMNITHASLLNPHTDGNLTLVPDTEQIILQFGAPFTSGQVLSLHFEYPLSSGLSGFYRSDYQGADNVTHTLATTQMEAQAARRAFPCFDEPAFKAPYTFEMTAPQGQGVLFNSLQQAQTAQPDGRVLHQFRPTPAMSSYLVAFIVGDLANVSRTVPALNGNVIVSVWGTPARAADLQAALGFAAALVPLYEAWLGVPYPLAKLDLVAIPDFAAGAMENLGLITFRETDLLVSSMSGVLGQRRVAEVVAHEMAHLWFGDLVTCNYWNEIWLNEGFATYFEAAAADAVLPSYGILDTFYVDNVVGAMVTDARSKSTHPLSVPAGKLTSVAAIEAMFDGISYNKGGSVLRMLRAFLDRDSASVRYRRLLQAQEQDMFLMALQSYLETYSLKTATATQLWGSVASWTGQDVSTWMQPWTFRSGYPLLTVSLQGLDVLVTQAPFTVTGVQPCNGSDLANVNGPWWVPVSFQLPGQASASWREMQQCAMPRKLATLPEASSWVKLNAGQTGVYRVNYPPAQWQSLAVAAAQYSNGQATLSGPDLAGLLDDAFHLAQIGEADIGVFLNLTRVLPVRNLTETGPWSLAGAQLVYMQSLIAGDPSQPGCAAQLGSYISRSLADPMLARLAVLNPGNTVAGADSTISNAITGLLNATWTTPSTANQTRILRAVVVSLAGEVNDTALSSQAVQLLPALMSGRQDAVDADVRSSVYNTAAGSGSPSAWNSLRDMYTAAGDATEKARLLAALAHASTPETITAALQFALSPAVKSQDLSLITAVAARGGQSLQMAWDFMNSNWDALVAKLGGDDEAAVAMGKMFSRIAARFATTADVAKVTAVFNAHKGQLEEQRWLADAQQGIETNVRWLQRNSAPTCSWLASLDL